MKSNFDNTYGNSSLKKIQQLKNFSILSVQNSQICISGHVEWIFDNNAKNFSPESIGFPPKNQKKEPRKKFNFNPFSLKTLIWKRRILPWSSC